jgi:hypothetical protein
MYEKDAEQSSTDREENDRLNQSRKQQGEELDQPPAPDKKNG